MTANASPQTGQTVRIRSGQSRSRRAEARIALLFVLPAILLVLVFRIIPLFWGVRPLADQRHLDRSR